MTYVAATTDATNTITTATWSLLLVLLLTLLLTIYPADYVGNRRSDIFVAVQEFVALRFGL